MPDYLFTRAYSVGNCGRRKQRFSPVRSCGRRSWTFATILTFVFALLIIILPVQVRAAELSVKDVLPAPGFAGEWTIDGNIELYDKETLFNHINGEAELYFPYGFAALASANYINKINQELSIVADVYQVASLLDAFGIYSNYRKPNNLPVSIGADGFASPSQLMFYQDKYFVRLQVSGETNLPKDILLACARAISQNLPAGAGPPRELDVLNIPALVPQSERYLAQSLLGYAFFRRGLIADVQVLEEKMQIFAIPEDTQALARRTFDQYCAYLQAEGRSVQLTGDAASRLVIAVDPLYGGVQVMQSGKYVAGVVRIKNTALGKKIMEQLSRQIIAKTGG